ncbi:tetratricopeptide repeat protein [bacterium]|nr:tetratricopeptide repeat protein [bacterium]MCP5461928.1 tetratricopeptide repeat protein [bacterium]
MTFCTRFRFVLAVLFLMVCGGCAFTPSKQTLQPFLDDVKQLHAAGRSVTNLSDFSELSDEDFNLAAAILAVHKTVDPSIDAMVYLEKVDWMAAELAYHLENKTTDKAKVNVLTNFIWNKGFVSPDPFWKNYLQESYYEQWFLRYSSFTDMLDQKKGNCLSLSILYLVLAERTGLPVYGVAIPEHLFVRYDSGTSIIHIEPTDNGTIYDEQDYVRFDDKDYSSLPRTYYFTNLSRKEIFGCYLLNVGALYYMEKNYESALQFYLLAHKCNPRDPAILQVLGNTYLKLRDYSKAMKAYKLGLQYNPDNARVYHSIGTIHSQFDRYDQALDAFSHAVSIDPLTAGYWNDKGLILVRLERHEEAIEAYDKALELDSKMAFIYCNKGISLYHLQNYHESRRMFDRALELDPLDENAWYCRARLAVQTDNIAEALSDLEKAKELNPEEVIWAAKRDPGFNSLAENPDFIRLVKP